MTRKSRVTLLLVAGIIILVVGMLMAVGVLPPVNAAAISEADRSIQGTTGVGVALVGLLVLMAGFGYWYERR